MGMLILIVLLVAAGVLAYSYFRRSRGGSGNLFPGREDPLEIARRRYAAGEISKEEFKQIRRDLEEGGGGA